MANGIYVSMNGAAARTRQLDRVADTLANADTPGFRAEHPTFRSVVAKEGSVSQTYTEEESTALSLQAGRLNETGRGLDLALPEGIYLALDRGKEAPAFTRAGHLELGADGSLQSMGHRVLDASGAPIFLPTDVEPSLLQDGEVMVEGRQVATLGRFAVEGALKREGVSLLVPAEKGIKVQRSDAKLRVGVVELSNLEPVTALVQMVSAQRSFEASMRAIETYRAIDSTAIELGKVR